MGATAGSKAALVSLTVLGLLLKIDHLLPFRLQVSSHPPRGAHPASRMCPARPCYWLELVLTGAL